MVDLAKLVASAFPSDRKQFDSVIIISNSVKKIKEIYYVIPKETEITILSSKSRVVESFDESDISVQLMDESLSSMGLQILTQLHDMILQAIGEGRISRGERILVVLGDPIDGLFSIDTTFPVTMVFSLTSFPSKLFAIRDSYSSFDNLFDNVFSIS